MRRLDGSISEMLFHSKEVDPALGYREADGDILARHLPELPRRKARHQHVRAQLHLVPGDTPHRFQLQRQLAVLRRPHAEAHQLNVARIRRLEPVRSGMLP